MTKANSIQSLVTNPKEGCRVLDMCQTRFFELLKTGEIESYKDGRSRKVVIESLHRYVERHRAAGTAQLTKSAPGLKIARASDDSAASDRG